MYISLYNRINLLKERIDKMIDDFIKENKKEMIENLQNLIQIPSVYTKSKNPLMPFGENVNRSLEYVLTLGKQLGFKTKKIATLLSNYLKMLNNLAFPELLLFSLEKPRATKKSSRIGSCSFLSSK